MTIDTVVPDASKTIAIDSISDDTGLSNSDFITSDTSLTLHARSARRWPTGNMPRSVSTAA